MPKPDPRLLSSLPLHRPLDETFELLQGPAVFVAAPEGDQHAVALYPIEFFDETRRNDPELLLQKLAEHSASLQELSFCLALAQPLFESFFDTCRLSLFR
jgi:hypothetical protein